MKVLRQLYRGLEALYEVESGIDPVNHLVTTRSEREPRTRERLLFREADDGVLEVSLALDSRLVHQVTSSSPDRLTHDDQLGRTLPVVEGLSHLLYLCEAARCERPVSGLELETQAEVDKLALCLLLDWRFAESRFSRLIDRLYHRFHWAPGLCPELKTRYETANRIALQFCRKLEPTVRDRSLEKLRRILRSFWTAPMGEKRALAACTRLG